MTWNRKQTPEAAQRDQLVTRTYIVGDLARSEEELNQLSERIQRSVNLNWDRNGGSGTIRPFTSKLLLIVRQREDVHEEITVFLMGLRERAKEKPLPYSKYGRWSALHEDKYVRVPFKLGAIQKYGDDWIKIEEVRGTADTFKVGGTYEVKGTYRLASRDEAILLVSVTKESFGPSEPTVTGSFSTRLNTIDPQDRELAMIKVAKSQSLKIKRGEGRFTLVLPMTYSGKPHVSFYPEAGEGFGHVYFGTGESVLQKGWWENKKGEAANSPTLQPLDLSGSYQQKADQFPKNTKYPWGVVPRGKQTFGKIPFNVDGMICLWGAKNQAQGQVFAEKVAGIPVNRTFETLYVYHSTFFVSPEGTPVYQLTFHYTNGTSSTSTVRYGVHARDWYQTTVAPVSEVSDPKSEMVWQGVHPTRAETKLRFYASSIDNPQPELEVKSISLASSKGDSAGCLLAMTTGPANSLKGEKEELLAQEGWGEVGTDDLRIRLRLQAYVRGENGTTSSVIYRLQHTEATKAAKMLEAFFGDAIVRSEPQTPVATSRVLIVGNEFQLAIPTGESRILKTRDPIKTVDGFNDKMLQVDPVPWTPETDKRRIKPADERIYNALEAPTIVQFVETQLSDGLKFLADQHGIEIVLDKVGLERTGVKDDVPVTLSLENVQLQVVLKQMLEKHKLGYRVRNGVLSVTGLPKELGKPNELHIHAIAPGRTRVILEEESGAKHEIDVIVAGPLPPAKLGEPRLSVEAFQGDSLRFVGSADRVDLALEALQLIDTPQRSSPRKTLKVRPRELKASVEVWNTSDKPVKLAEMKEVTGQKLVADDWLMGLRIADKVTYWAPGTDIFERTDDGGIYWNSLDDFSGKIRAISPGGKATFKIQLHHLVEPKGKDLLGRRGVCELSPILQIPLAENIKDGLWRGKVRGGQVSVQIETADGVPSTELAPQKPKALPLDAEKHSMNTPDWGEPGTDGLRIRLLLDSALTRKSLAYDYFTYRLQHADATKVAQGLYGMFMATPGGVEPQATPAPEARVLVIGKEPQVKIPVAESRILKTGSRIRFVEGFDDKIIQVARVAVRDRSGKAAENTTLTPDLVIVDPAGDKPSEEEQRIERCLDKKISLQFDERPLSEVLKDISAKADINIVVDHAGLEQEGASSQTRVSVNVDNVPIRIALSMLLSSHKLGYIIQSEVLKITSQRNTVEPMEFRILGLAPGRTHLTVVDESGAGRERKRDLEVVVTAPTTLKPVEGWPLRVVPDVRSNLVFVFGSEDGLAQAEQLIKQLDALEKPAPKPLDHKSNPNRRPREMRPAVVSSGEFRRRISRVRIDGASMTGASIGADHSNAVLEVWNTSDKPVRLAERKKIAGRKDVTDDWLIGLRIAASVINQAPETDTFKRSDDAGGSWYSLDPFSARGWEISAGGKVSVRIRLHDLVNEIGRELLSRRDLIELHPVLEIPIDEKQKDGLWRGTVRGKIISIPRELPDGVPAAGEPTRPTMPGVPILNGKPYFSRLFGHGSKKENSGEIAVELHWGSGTPPAALVDAMAALHKLPGVVLSLQQSGDGNSIVLAIVRDPSGVCLVNTNLRTTIDEVLRSQGVKTVRWETDRIDSKVGKQPRQFHTGIPTDAEPALPKAKVTEDRDSVPAGKVAIDLYAGWGFWSNQAMLAKVVRPLMAVKDVAVVTCFGGTGDTVRFAIVRDPHELIRKEELRTGKESVLRSTIREQLSAKGIKVARWDLGKGAVAVPVEVFQKNEIRTPVAKTDDEKAVAKLVLVFMGDKARRAIPCLVLNAAGETLIVTTVPATIVPDDMPPAIDRTFLELPGKPSIQAQYDPRGTKELAVFRPTVELPSIPLKETGTVSVGDFVSAIGPNHVPYGNPNDSENGNPVVMSVDSETDFEFKHATSKFHYTNLIELNVALPEGTPIYKNGKLVGLTLLGQRFLGKGKGISYVLPTNRIVKLFGDIRRAKPSGSTP